MINLQNIEDVKVLQAHLRSSLDTPQGKEVMVFLEEICGWYDFSETEPNKILMAHGKRQVLATLKTLLRLNAEDVSSLADEL